MKRKFYLMLFCLLLFTMALPGQAATRLNVKKKTLVVHQTVKLKLKGTSKKAKWSSSDSSIAAVSSKGKVKAKKAGSALIYARVSGKTYRCKIKVVVPSMNTSISMAKGGTVSISIGNKKSFSSITYKSSNKKIATVTSKGKVKGVKAGTCYIKVCFNKAYTMRVRTDVVSVKTSSTVIVMRGSSKQLIPTHKGSSGVYKVLYPSMGTVVNGVYYSKDYGWNQVTYTSGKYQHTFSIRNYCWEAHRGYTAVYPDNTLESIRAAKAAGASSVEIDVRATRDGYFVLLHDGSMKTISNGLLTDNVRTYWLKTLQSRDYIYKNGQYYHIATLEEALQLTKQLGLNVSVEMKTLPDKNTYSYLTATKEEMTKRLCEIVKKYGNSYTSILVSTEENAKLLATYSDGTIPIRVINDSYAASSALRQICSQYSFIMPSSEFATRYYKGYLWTTDNPF